ncbi:MAG: hypothetical protein A3G35_10330 [candidate division NC10 bacterium RIFCSPLOWO2_12_FULL_66_18]|nr:MAG: hypothetical protein A3H39_04365 [candidate division NC10 bacterium RIFCSPLOWO2_02_FULL_66_22]OGC02847.1 MAG: hypothetical protein A3G35_10330 [candidate division NC10 bacterium RIFCSPLOWO2_12_FULL_66_18]
MSSRGSVQAAEQSQSADVLVAGGGMAGIAAAVSAARAGADVLLVERGATLGGIATAGLNCSFMGVDRSVLGGIIWEVLDRLAALEGAIEGVYTPFDPEVFKTVALEMVTEAGVRLLLHSWLLEAVTRRGRVTGVKFVTKAGIRKIAAQAFVDATGDGDLAASAGAPFESGRADGRPGQPMTVMLRMGNVDTRKLIAYTKEHPDQLYQNPLKCVLEERRDPPLFLFSGFFDLIRRAKEAGELYLERESMGLIGLPSKGQVLVNATRVHGMDATDPDGLTKAEVEARRQAWSVVRFLRRHMPGFGEAHLIDTAASIGVRESRRVKGQYMLTREDILGEARFPDAVARNFFPMDIHGPADNPLSHTWLTLRPGGFYEIPYRCLVPLQVKGVLVAGRCISATHEAHGSTRTMPCCLATGQAAGVAAAVAVREGKSPQELDPQLVRRELMQQKAILGD